VGKYNLVTIRPKGFIHSSAFAEIKDSLAWSLAELGHEVMLTENAWSHQGTNILFGGELIAPTGSIPDNTILFNMEQPTHPRIENVRRLAQGHTVWDIYTGNVREWHRLGISAQHLQIGYTPNLTRIPPSPMQDIDVFFAGWMTARRIKLMQDLRASGLKVYASDCCYGGYRDQIISRSKICLNIHHDGRDLFEIVRVSYLLANGKCVVTETSQDDIDHADLLTSVIFCDYDEMVDLCQKIVTARNPTNWETNDSFRRRDFTQSVAHALNGNRLSPGPLTSPQKIQARYAQGLEAGDMKDFLPLLRGLAQGRMLEIGVRDGASTSALLLGLEDRDPEGKLYSIDIQDCSSLWSHPQWNFIQGDSKAQVFESHFFSLAFIDGDHSREGFLADLMNAMNWVRPGGLILCHDITPLPNYTNEARGGDWPSEYVGAEFFDYARQHKLRHFVYPGAWGMGVIVK
jgi:predicted O-methyltransferase YrrM